MDENHQRRHRLSHIRLINAYGVIAKVLMMIPLPIRIPSLEGGMYSAEVGDGLVQAYEALQDVPMDAEVKEWTGLIVLDWISACEFMFHDEEEEAGWHLDLVEVQTARILVGADLVLERLASDTDQE